MIMMMIMILIMIGIDLQKNQDEKLSTTLLFLGCSAKNTMSLFFVFKMLNCKIYAFENNFSFYVSGVKIYRGIGVEGATRMMLEGSGAYDITSWGRLK